jgi:hypothetical protein
MGRVPTFIAGVSTSADDENVPALSRSTVAANGRKKLSQRSDDIEATKHFLTSITGTKEEAS